MSVTLTGSGGLFTRLGKIGKYIRAINTHQATTIIDRIEEVMAAYDTLRQPPAALPGLRDSNKQGAGNIFAALRQTAADTVGLMVYNDKPSRASSLALALQEVITQMIAGSATVKASTVGATSSNVTGIQGDGVLVLTTKRGDGLVQENIVAEVGPMLCTVDSQTGGATEGLETFQFAGEPDIGLREMDDWPTGSGALATLTAIDASQDASSNNLLTNSDFETWTGSPLALSKWEITTGVYGTDLVRNSTAAYVYKGTYSAKIVGGSTNTAFRQLFNDSSTGTAGVLLPNRSYAINLMAMADVVPAAGTLIVELIDGTGTVIADDQGTNNTFTIDCTALDNTVFESSTGVFRTPKNVPETVYLRIRVGTDISSGSNVYLDRLAMGLMTPLYAGGPNAAIFSGAERFILGDGWNVTMTNDRGSATYLSTFQALFDRLFDMRGLGLLLPSAGSPTIADTLITS